MLTLPVPPSPTRTSLKVGVCCSAILRTCVGAKVAIWVREEVVCAWFGQEPGYRGCGYEGVWCSTCEAVRECLVGVGSVFRNNLVRDNARTALGKGSGGRCRLLENPTTPTSIIHCPPERDRLFVHYFLGNKPCSTCLSLTACMQDDKATLDCCHEFSDMTSH